MVQSSILAVSRPRAIAGKAICAAGLLLLLLQVAVWVARGHWYAITFLYVLTPVLQHMGWAGWLIFPQSSRGVHEIVTTVLSLPLGLTLFAVGAGLAQFQENR